MKIKVTLSKGYTCSRSIEEQVEAAADHASTWTEGSVETVADKLKATQQTLGRLLDALQGQLDEEQLRYVLSLRDGEELVADDYLTDEDKERVSYA